MTRTLLLASAGMAALALATGAVGQPTVPAAAPAAKDGRKIVYEAAFFAQYAPRSAYDIVQRVPGFTLDLGATQTQQGSVDVRGFAGTAGNVVINGCLLYTSPSPRD